MISRRDLVRLAGLTGTSRARPRPLAPGVGVTAAAAEKKRVFSGRQPGASFRKFIDPLPGLAAMPDTGAEHH